ncbi:FkbM family methyltransferase [Paramagnetospirillum caucaseum]|nr:FkbM family methyltransferase [Paramagnetospirillum caucaseum]
MTAAPPLLRTLGVDEKILVVDIGANPIDGDPPYKTLLRSNHARVVGFEPNPLALEKLQTLKGKDDLYLPHAVGDGREHTLHICQGQGMTSLLEPNPNILGMLHGFPEWGRVIRKEQVPTVRLDDIPETEGVDYIKIDIQGGELMALSNAPNRLAGAVLIHTEVEFLPMYIGQPLFSDLDIFLRGHGFVLHKFHPLAGRMLQPLMLNNDVYASGNQIIWADAVYFRDISKMSAMSPAQLLKLATIAHDCYGSFDLAVRLLLEHERQTGSAYGQRLLEVMTGQRPGGNRRG